MTNIINKKKQFINYKNAALHLEISEEASLGIKSKMQMKQRPEILGRHAMPINE